MFLKRLAFPGKNYFVVVACILVSSLLHAQMQAGYWKGSLQREGNMAVPVVFHYDGNQALTFINIGERISVIDFRQHDDSIFFAMPVFESSFRVKVTGDSHISGIWEKGTSRSVQPWRFEAHAATDSLRFPMPSLAGHIHSGKWAFDITRTNGTHRPAVGNFTTLKNGVVTGTIRTPSGDYRFLDGIVRNDSLYLATFDGSHAFYFTARVKDSGNTLEDGIFYSGAWPAETFSAQRDNAAQLPPANWMDAVPEDLPPLNFCFSDVDGKKVCLSEERFKGKAIVLQMMGSWCPNCMDETQWLSRWYEAEKPADVEVISLAYEYSEDFARSAKSLDKFRQRFNVPYPMLITGAKVSDDQKTAKTLPGLPEITSFPTLLFLDKNHRLAEAHVGFYGPASANEYAAFQKEFAAILSRIVH